MTFVIAEVGSSWNTLTDCLNSISAAKACGADACKFQLFDEVALYGAGYSVPTFGADVKHPFLPPAWLPHLKEKCAAVGIELMVTAFSPEFVEVVDPYVKRHKVASSDLTYPQLLEAVAKTGKPVILSCGASSRGDISGAMACLNNRATLLYCNAAYPSRWHDLRGIDRLRNWGGPTIAVGFSDHTRDVIYAPWAAVHTHGATVIEKHFQVVPGDFPDTPHSLNVDEFQAMVKAIRGTDNPLIAPTSEEKPMLLRHNRRLIATRHIEAGQPFKYGVNYGAYRSLKDDSKGLTPFAWQHVDNCTAKVALQPGDSIGPGDLCE